MTAQLLLSAAACAEQGFFAQTPLDAEALSALRGGFMTEDGFKISLGIDRAVLINNALVDATSIRIPDLGAVTAGSPAAVQVTGAAVGIIQNGPGNFLDRASLQHSGPGMLTIIQNSLNNQVIQGLTVITIDVSGLRAATAAQATSALGAQLHNFR